MRTEHLLHRRIANYDLIDVLGRGGMSTVFLAQSLQDPQEQVAIKVLNPAAFSIDDEFTSFKARFLREARTVHQLHHEHILPILAYGETDDGLFYMLMPVISGGNLSRLMDKNPDGLPLPEVADYLAQLASAVDFSNQQGMVHRDIKPANVLLDEKGRVYLADFGIMRFFDSSQALDDAPLTLTTTGKLFGTPSYMAPERFKGEPAEPATDIYALGVLLYQLVTGHLPFEAENPLALGMKHLNEEPPRPRALRQDLPEPAEAAILKALAKQPDARFATATALADAFSAGLAGEWVTELLPFAAVLAASPLNARISPQEVLAPMLLADNTYPRQAIADPAPEATLHDIPFAPAPVIRPPGTRREPSLGRNLQAFTLGMLVIALLVFGGLLALAFYTFKLPVPTLPGLTTPAAVPTRTESTPTATHSITPAVRNTPAPASGTTVTPGAGSTPTAPAGTTPTPTPVPPTPTSPPTATPVPPTPVPTPTSGATT